VNRPGTGAGAANRVVEAVRYRLARLSLRSRIGLLAAVAVGLAVALSSLAAYVTVRQQMLAQMDESLLDRARAAADSPLTNPNELAKMPSAALGAGDVRIVLVTAEGVSYSAEGDAAVALVGAPELAAARGELDQSLRTVTEAGGHYRVAAVPISQNLALVLAQSTADLEQTLSRLGLVLFLIGILGMMMAAIAGLAIARTGLRPVQRLTAAIEHVTRTEELAPIPVPPARLDEDELARLAASFNAMLAALARSRARQQQLVADAGHELRTPLTSLRTNLDLLAQSLAAGDRGLPPADRDELLADVRAQLEELSGLVQDLVELAREDSPSTAEAVDLAAVCERAVERVRRRAPKVTFEVSLEPWEVHGEAATLERAVTNLLDNAAKWSPPDGTVWLRLRGGKVQVVDQGPGIAESDLPHVFERFYRSSAARTMPGSGLGLAIVRQAAQRHGGTVSAGPAPGGGTLMTLWIPPADAASQPLRRPPVAVPEPGRSPGHGFSGSS
jgi:two-component system sensor histidine kinase MprB